MRIAVEAWAAAEVPAGRGRYVREVLRALAALNTAHQWILLCREPWEELPGMRWRPLRGRGALWLAGAGIAASREADLLFATTSYALPGLVTVPAAAVVYDCVAFDPSLQAPGGSQLERLTLPLAVRRCAQLLCISESTRTELVARYPAAAPKSVVTPLAAAAPFSAAPADPAPLRRYGIDRPYVLSAGTLEPRKNLPRLVEAFATLAPEVRDGFQLVLVGSRGWGMQPLDALLARHAGHVRALGYVPDDDLAALYAQAALVAYPSLQEGFGLPVIEAMAAGAPVLTSDRGSMAEVGGDAAIYVDPTSVDSIRAGLARALSDPSARAARSAVGRARAAAFSWETTARMTLDALERAAAVR